MIETLIDGERTIYKSIKEFCDMKLEGLKDWQSLYFRLKKIGKESGLSNNIVFIRFLGLVPCGRKFFRDNEKAICEEGLSDEIMLVLYIKTSVGQNWGAIRCKKNSGKGGGLHLYQ